MHGLTFRLAKAEDSQPFAEWIGESTQIPVEDVRASLKETNPTSITLVIEDKDGKVLLFAPTYAVAMLGFIGFNPEASPLERARALDVIKGAAQAFWQTYGVTEINTLSREDYPIAQWALRHGFTKDSREVLRLTAQPDTGTN